MEEKKEKKALVVQPGNIVRIHFTCKTEDGTVFESSDGKEPLAFIAGEEQITLPGLDQAVLGMSLGETKTVKVSAEPLFGPHNQDLVRVIQRDQLPQNALPSIGTQLRIKTENNEESVIRVTDISASTVTLDANHPLAGKNLLFDIDIVDIKLTPKNIADEHYRKGVELHDKGQIDEAIDFYKKAFRTNSFHTDSFYNLAVAYHEKGMLDKAIILYRILVKQNPKLMKAFNNLGNALKQQGKLDEALTSYQKALDLNPNHSDTYNNLGAVYQAKGKMEDAITYYQKAISLNPDFAEAFNNLGTAFQYNNKIDKAISIYEKAITLKQEFAEAHFHLAIALLLSGRYEEGWQEYEWRLKLKTPEYMLSQPIWDGSDISAQTILVRSEQGFGDTIQFIRYIPLLTERGHNVIIECQEELTNIVRSVNGVTQVTEKGKELPTFDICCSLLSLPLHFHTTIKTIPAHIPYLNVQKEQKEKWREELLQDPPGFRVGLVWRGDPRYRRDHVRSCSLHLFQNLADIEGVMLYSLQKEPSSQQAKDAFGKLKLIDYMKKIEDFYDTAALIENLDLIISVDTAVAHLAGALGKEVWTLIPFAPDWRWMLNRTDSPWYPSMKLFRQSSIGDWETVIEEVSAELRKKVKSHEKA